MICTATYDMSAVAFDDTETQVNYDTITRVFDITSTDLTLIGMTKIRKVSCEYQNYPMANYPALEYPDADVPKAS